MATKRGKYASTKRGYDAYLDLYNKRKNELAKKGYTMGDKVFSKLEWEANYVAVKNERTMDIKAGKRATIGDVNRELVKEQTYSYSAAQAKAQQKALSKEGTKVKILDIRAGKVAMNWAAIKERREELSMDPELSGLDIKRIIAQEFFGS